MLSCPKVSVIMSIYNEPKSYIIDCFNSIIKQSLTEFEVIVILDNPERQNEVEEVFVLLGDNRFNLIVNENNVGLAESMNIAMSLASSDVLARMDADDICYIDRLKVEYEYIQKGYDVVFSKYLRIDETGHLLSDQTIPFGNPTPQQIRKELLFRNSYIHHPTVMMKKNALLNVGGYRPFPCSQDFDLWLRMNEIGCTFYLCDQPLLYYRINSSSISSTRWFQQRLTIFYIFRLSVERASKRYDSFSLESYYKYLNNNGLKSQRAQKRLKESLEMHSEAIKLKKSGSKYLSLLIQIRALIHSRLLRNHYLNMVKKYIILLINKR